MYPLSDTRPVDPLFAGLLPPQARLHQRSIDLDQPAAPESAFPEVPMDPMLDGAVPKRRLQYAAGRYCALVALRALGSTVLTVPRAADGLPVWPDGFTGSISHCEDLACAVAIRTAAARSAGFDVERVITRQRAARVGPLIVDRDELLAARAAGFDEALGVTLQFSAKESLFKCLFPIVHRWFGYSAARIRPNEDGTFDARLTTHLAELFPAGTTISGRWTVAGGRVYTALFLTRD